MKIIIDNNIIISYIISRTPENTITRLMKYIITEKITVLYSPHQEDELSATLRTKKSISNYIKAIDAEEFIPLFESIVTKVPPITTIPKITRDPKDDYLLAYSVEHLVDYLITGDQDLLTLKEHLSTPQIISPQEFLNLSM